MANNKDEDNMERTLHVFSTVVSEQDQKMWVQQAAAKYYKVEYEILQKEVAQLDKQIKHQEEKINKMEKEIPEVKKLKESLKSSIIIGSKVCKYLLEKRNNVLEDVQNWKKKINEKEEWMTNYLNEERMKRENNNELYKQVVQKRNDFKLLQIEHAMLLKKHEVQQCKIKMRLEMNQMLFRSKIVVFVEVVTNYNREVTLDREIAAMQKALNAMMQKVNLPRQIKLPTFQMTMSQNFGNRSIQPLWAAAKLPQPKMGTAITNQGSTEKKGLKELQQRSYDRKKQFLQTFDNTHTITSIYQRKKNNIPKDMEVGESLGTVGASPSKKVKLLDNVVISKSSEIALPSTSKSEQKKAKKVSFGQVTQEKENISGSDIENKGSDSFAFPSVPVEDNVVSKYFQQRNDGIHLDNEINKSFGYTLLSPEYAAENTSDNVNDSMNQTIRDEFFSLTPEPTNNNQTSIFGNFGFGATTNEQSGNPFSFF